MKTRHVSVVAVAAALALAGCSNGSSSTTASAGNTPTSAAPVTSTSPSDSPTASGTDKNQTATINVTLMKDSIPPATQQAALDEMKKQYPNVTVKVEILTWDVRAAKWTAAWSAKPATIDAAEMGNTDVLSWASQGALADLDPTAFETNATWLDSLKQAGTFDGKLYGVPYYAGSRVLWYNKKTLGTATAPTTLDELQTLAAKYKTGGNSGIYLPGRNWYVNTGFLVDAGMDSIATQTGGTWKANLASDAGIKGIERLKAFAAAVSAAPADVDETNDDKIFGQKKAAMVIEPGWWNGVVSAPGPKGQAFPAADLGAWTMPGTNGPLPQFLGGSNLAVAANSAHKDLAVAWVNVLAGTVVQTLVAKAGSIPNTTTLVDQVPEGPGKMAAAAAAGKGWFTPTSVNWSKVETANIMKDFFTKVLTPGTDAKTVAAEYDKKIEDILNAAA